MKQMLLGVLSIGATTLLPLQQAEAHVAYYNLFSNPTTVITAAGATTTYAGSSIVSGNYGWADATDADWGDSHKASWISFDITNPGGALVNISVAGDGITEYSTVYQGVALRMGDLTPAFSLYKGLVPDESHDAATYGVGSQDYSKEGAWQALADTTMGNDLGEINTIQYLAHAGVVDGLATSVSLSGFFLGQGSYSLTIGGTCYLRTACGAFDPYNADDTARGYNVSMSVTSVPLPAAAWLLLTGLVGMLGLKKRIDVA